jgi:transketolase
MRNQILQKLIELAQKDDRICIVTADIAGTPFEEFQKKFPDRFFNVGIAEANMIGVSAGLAMSGKIPIAVTIAVFAVERCFEQIRQDACYQRQNVKVVGFGGGTTYGPLAATHHAIEDIAIMRAIPGMTVVAAADPREAGKALVALAQMDGPAYLRIGRAGEPIVYPEDYDFKVGKAMVLKDGKDITLISYGLILPKVLKAREELEKQGITARVINMHTLKPIDKECVLNAARQTRAILTVEDHNIIGGLGSAVAEILADEGIPTRFRRVGINDIFTTIGSQEELWEEYKMGTEGIKRAAEQLLD